ncbi:hypothetical protein Aperf_G00000038812 [Anoplocephala perfoliata]
MLGPNNNYDFAFEASLSRGVLDEDGKRLDRIIEDNYSRKITRCCQKTLKVLTSAVGTLILVCIYLVVGALMFQYLEQANELKACYETYEKYRDKLNTSVVRATGIVGSGLNSDVVASQLESALIDFAETLFALDFPPSKNCTDLLEPYGSQWNWINALYFCATVITTIGYGHVAPTTQWGRLVCIFYCILGIPLLLIYLGSIGQMLAYLFRFIYMNFCCCRCFRDILIRRRNQRRLKLIRLQEDLRRHMEMRAKLNGEPVPPPKMAPVVMDDESDEDDEIREIYHEFQDTEEAGVPITIVMLVIAVYVAIGAFLFRIWEVDWTITDGAYFAVITISTIGFGDLVPGNGRFDKPETITELVIGAFYCIVGLALLSMCFELMKEEFVDKIRWIGRSLHIIAEDANGEMDDDTGRKVPKTGEDGAGDELRRDFNFVIPSNGTDSEMFDAVSIASSTAAKTYQDSCQSQDRLKNSSSELKEPNDSLSRHGDSVGSKASSEQSQRTASIQGTNDEEKALAAEGDFGLEVMGSDFGGEDNEAFGGDMVYEEEVDEMAKET